MFKTAVGHSNDPDTETAAEELISQCLSELGSLEPKAGLLLAAIDFDHPVLLDAICSTWPQIELVGCTTDGEISSVLSFQQDSVTLMLFSCDDSIQVGAGIGENVSSNPAVAAQAAVEHACRGPHDEVRLCITTPESLTADGCQIIDGLRQALPEAVPVVGGLAADQWQFKTTYQFHGRRVLTDAVPVLIFSGALQCAHGVASGWHPIGNPGIVTRSEGNVVFEIDGAPALEYYRSHLGQHEPSSNYPLVVFTDEQQYYLRAPNGEYSDADGSVGFFAEVPQGAKVQMSESSREDILAATRESAELASVAFGAGVPEAALFFSCASRRQLLGTRTAEEYQLASASFPQKIPSCGFYTNGEISPMARGTATEFHNETFITLLLGASTPAAGSVEERHARC